jgi:serine/threonine-protein kinase
MRHDRMTRLTFGGTYGLGSVWSPDGNYLLVSGRDGMFSIRSDGVGQAQRLTLGKTTQVAWSFAPDRQRLALIDATSGGFSLFTASVGRDTSGLRVAKPEPFLQTNYDQRHPSFSPEGHWIAYSSTESGSFDVYVRSFPNNGGKWQVSTGGGVYPIWSRTGKSLFFRTLDSRVMVVTYAVKDHSFIAERPRLWTDRHLANFGPIGVATYDVSRDGDKIVALMPAETAQDQQSHITVLLNFFDEIRRRVTVSK